MRAKRPENTPVRVVQLHPVARKVVDLLEAHIERAGYELVTVEYRKGARRSLLRLLVDRPEGGIGLDDLERLSPVVGDLLDVYDPIEGSYNLELASPGINRPLSKLNHFESFRGRRIRVRTRRPAGAQKVFKGILIAISDQGIELDDEISGRRQRIEFDELEEANYEHDFDS